MDGRSSQSGYFYGHSSYDQMVAGIQPGDSYGTAQWKLQSHYSAGGRDASGASLYGGAASGSSAYPSAAPYRGGGGRHAASGGGSDGAAVAARPPSPVVRAVGKLLLAGVALASLAVFFSAEFLAPGLSVADGLKSLPETGFFSTKPLRRACRGMPRSTPCHPKPWAKPRAAQ